LKLEEVKTTKGKINQNKEQEEEVLAEVPRVAVGTRITEKALNTKDIVAGHILPLLTTREEVGLHVVNTVTGTSTTEIEVDIAGDTATD